MKTLNEREMAHVEGGILWIPIIIGIALVAFAMGLRDSGCSCGCQ